MKRECAICGRPRIEEAHVKGKKTFPKNGNKPVGDRNNNIIPLCRNHHDDFDNSHIGIIPDKSGFIIEEGDDCIAIKSRIDLSYLKDEYIRDKNLESSHMVRFRLGIISGNEHGKMW